MKMLRFVMGNMRTNIKNSLLLLYLSFLPIFGTFRKHERAPVTESMFAYPSVRREKKLSSSALVFPHKTAHLQFL
jgi:hypothetical protein